ncbi:MAG: hypothetical protein B7X06_03850 [Verrucomicrobia bacterium 21-51-4]|nr:MAG: hypothetical protein B7X06_03850 [Verrucomicrobia bacterium 21-51-4]HQU09732.1 outer membrane lipoprotein-sorting protein [Opitutales bacterium]
MHNCLNAGVRVLLLGWIFLTLGLAPISAQVRSNALQDLPKLKPQEATELLDAVRTARLRGDYCLHVALSQIPRKGPQVTTYSVIWGTWNAQGPCMRVEIFPDGGRNSPNTTQWLLQNGARPEAWVAKPGCEAEKLTGAALYEPIMPGLEMSAFELQMGFLYWPEAKYIGPQRLKGRCAQCFELTAPEGSLSPYPFARVALDSGFYCVLKAELFDKQGKVARVLKILDFKKAGEQWIVQSLDDVNMHTHSKTRVQVIAAALGLSLPASLFTPQALTSTPPALAPEHFVLF